MAKATSKATTPAAPATDTKGVATKTDEAPKPPYKFFRAVLPNGEFVEKRSRMNTYVAVVVIERKDGSFLPWRWTSQAKSVNAQKNACSKSDACADGDTVHLIDVTEVAELLPPIAQVFESKKAAGIAAAARGMKKADIEEVEGGYRVKQSS